MLGLHTCAIPTKMKHLKWTTEISGCRFVAATLNGEIRLKENTRVDSSDSPVAFPFHTFKAAT